MSTIYIYKTGVGTEPHTDKAFAEQVLNLGEPIATLTEQEWSDCNGLARMIDGVLVLGKTDAEIAKEQTLADARQAEKELANTDWIENQLLRCSLLYGADSVEYTTLLANRMDLLTQRNAWVEVVRNADTL